MDYYFDSGYKVKEKDSVSCKKVRERKCGRILYLLLSTVMHRNEEIFGSQEMYLYGGEQYKLSRRYNFRTINL